MNNGVGAKCSINKCRVLRIFQTHCLTMTRTVLVRICSLIFLLKISEPAVCSAKAEAQSVFSKQGGFWRERKMYLLNHVYKRKQTVSEFACGLFCVGDESCSSVNYKASGIGKGLCELNYNADNEGLKIYDTEFNFLSKIIQVS